MFVCLYAVLYVFFIDAGLWVKDASLYAKKLCKQHPCLSQTHTHTHTHTLYFIFLYEVLLCVELYTC